MCIYINEARMYANVCVYISMSISKNVNKTSAEDSIDEFDETF